MSNKWTRADLERQLKRAQNMGWLPHFYEAGEIHDFSPAFLLAIASRETNLDPIWLTKPGDGGNGFGLMQVDAGTDRDFARSGKWKDARLGILRGAEILAEKRARNAAALQEGYISAIDRKGIYYSHHFSKNVEYQEDTLLHLVAAAYNSGNFAVYHFAKRDDPDYGTTRKDYGADVLARMEVFNGLIPVAVNGNQNYPALSATISAEAYQAIDRRRPIIAPTEDVLHVATSSSKSLWETITAGSGVTVLTALGFLRDNPQYIILLAVAIIAITAIHYARTKRHTELDAQLLAAAADPGKQTIRRG